MEERKFHDVASIFPMMAEEEFNDLLADIKENGLLEPIWVDKDGLIVDGRNRYLACKREGIKPEYRTYEGDGSLVAFVVSLNLKRRHLNSLQKSIIAVDIEKLFAVEAKERMLRGKGDDGSGGRGNKKIENLTAILPEGLNLNAEEVQLLAASMPESIDGLTSSQRAFVAIDVEPIIKASKERQKEEKKESRIEAAKVVGVGQHYVSDAKKLAAKAPDVIEAAMAGKITSMPDALKIAKMPETQRKEVLDKVDTGIKPSDAIRETVRETVRANLESVETIAVKAIEGVYDVIVIDPPWPMVKIDRDERPMQAGFDYPTMTIDEIEKLVIPCADDCHVWVWTTQKFLEDTFSIINYWGLRYVCTFVWHKPGGFQPIGLPQYNCEFVLYCRKGSPKFMDTKEFSTCFNAIRCGHSEKPEAFYGMVKRVTAGRRLDMFNRRLIEGFDTWGKEAAA